MQIISTSLRFSFRKQILCMTFVLLTVFVGALYYSSQNILMTSLSHQFLMQANSLSVQVKSKLKSALLAEDMSSVAAAAETILGLERVDYIHVFSYDESLLERYSSDYPQRDFNLDGSFLDVDDGFYDASYLIDASGVTIGKVLLSFSIDSVQSELVSVKRQLAVCALVLMALSLWGIWLMTGKLSGRIKALEKATHHFIDGKKNIVLPDKGDDEIAATGRAFKSMMWQIREKYEAMNLSPDGIVLVSANQRITHTNKALITILGERAGHLSGKPIAEFKRLLLDVLDREVHADIQDFEALKALPEITVEVPRLKILRCICKCVDSPDGQTFSEVFYLRDITQESEVDRMKSEFLTTAAHELRTPLASVMGFSELLMHNNYDVDKVHLIAETINRQSVNLKHLVDDLLDIARIEARGCDAVTLSLATAKKVVDECCELISGDDKSCELVYDSEQCVWPRLMMDANRIQQAMMNILTNAYKYSDDNGLVIVDTIELVDEFDLAWFGIRVTDQGIGMNQEQLARVGEKFYRADNAGSIPGTGLGIALTSEILALHDGHIEITSQLGQGTQVTLWIPVAQQTEQEARTG